MEIDFSKVVGTM